MYISIHIYIIHTQRGRQARFRSVGDVAAVLLCVTRAIQIRQPLLCLLLFIMLLVVGCCYYVIMLFAVIMFVLIVVIFDNMQIR